MPQRCLLGKSVGLFGFGEIGQHVSRLLAPFGCVIRACDPYVDDKVFAEADVERAEDMRRCVRGVRSFPFTWLIERKRTRS